MCSVMEQLLLRAPSCASCTRGKGDGKVWCPPSVAHGAELVGEAHDLMRSHSTGSQDEHHATRHAGSRRGEGEESCLEPGWAPCNTPRRQPQRRRVRNPAASRMGTMQHAMQAATEERGEECCSESRTGTRQHAAQAATEKGEESCSEPRMGTMQHPTQAAAEKRVRNPARSPGRHPERCHTARILK